MGKELLQQANNFKFLRSYETSSGNSTKETKSDNASHIHIVFAELR